MEKVKQENPKQILVRIADQLKKGQEELDALAVQFSLGKAEVKDKFEEVKKQMRNSILDYKEVLADRKENWVTRVKDKLDDLDQLLDKGKAETKVKFEEQKKNITEKLNQLKNEVRQNPEAENLVNHFTAAAEKMKLQLALLEKKIGEEKKELTEEFKEEMGKARTKIDSIIARTKEMKEDVDLKLDHFTDEIQLSYEHLKKAIKAL
jgi:hypothetical protein